MSAGRRRARPGTATPELQSSGPAGAAAAGERGRQGGRTLPKLRRPAGPRSPPLSLPCLPSAEHPRPAERSRSAGSRQYFLSVLFVCLLGFVFCYFSLLVFIWLSSLAGNGRGSGAWRRNKCGEREREPELNDRMRAA